MCNPVLFLSQCFGLSWQGRGCKWELVLNWPTWLNKGAFFLNKRCHKEGLKKWQLAQMALGCTQRANISNMHVNLSWLKVEERLTLSLLVFVRGIDMLKSQSCHFKPLAHSSDTHAYPTRHATRGLFTVQNKLWEEHSIPYSHNYTKLFSTSNNSCKQ